MSFQRVFCFSVPAQLHCECQILATLGTQLGLELKAREPRFGLGLRLNGLDYRTTSLQPSVTIK